MDPDALKYGGSGPHLRGVGGEGAGGFLMVR